MKRLILRLSYAASNQLTSEWQIIAADGNVLLSSPPIPLEELASALEAHLNQITHSLVIIPARDVLLTEVVVEEKQRRYLKKILPFLMEEVLLDNIANTHIVPLAPALTSVPLPVAVISKSLLQDYLHQLKDVGIIPDALSPELPPSPKGLSEWVLLVDRDTIWLRIGPYLSYSVPHALLPILLASLGEHLTASPPHVIRGLHTGFTNHSELLSAIKEACASAAPETVLEFTLVSSLFQVMTTSAPEDKINLLTGEFAPSKNRQRPLYSRMAVLLACSLVLAIGLNIAESSYYYYKSISFHQQSVALYQQLFPNDARIIDPRKQMESHLTETSNTTDSFLAVLQSAIDAWPIDQNLVQITKIAYTKADNILHMTVTSSTASPIHQLVEQLTTARLHAKVTELLQPDGKAIGQLEVER